MASGAAKELNHEAEVNIEISRSADPPIVLWAKDLSCSVGDQVILDSSSVVCRSGELTAILGPSGSGKTTLLNVLTGRLRKYEGEAGINDEHLSEPISKYLVNYVMATDRLDEYLTVRETIQHAARLRMPHRSATECAEEAAEIMNQLNISHCADVLVGGAWRKGISKGELKRLAVAQELLGSPCVLILDEPTTGLDASISYELIKILRRIAKERNLVVLCTLHQPSQRIYELFDSLVVMAGKPGKILYQGSPSKALPFLHSAGLTLGHDEQATSVPDAILDLVVGGVSSPAHNQSCLSFEDAVHDADCKASNSRSEVPKSHHRDSAVRTTSFKKLDETAPQRMSTSTYVSRKLQNPKIEDIEPHQEQPTGGYGPLPHMSQINVITGAQSWFSQFRICLVNQFTSNRRNPLTILVVMLVNIVQAVLLGCLFFQVQSDMKEVTTPDYLTWELFSGNQSVVRFIKGGINGAEDPKDLIDPLTDFLSGGINMRTHASILFEMVANPDMVNWLWDVTKCVRLHLPFDTESYPPWNFVDEATRSQRHLKDTFNLSSDVCWNDFTKYPSTTFGEWSMEETVTATTSLLQTLDMILNQGSTVLSFPAVNDREDLFFWLTFLAGMNPIAEPVFCCTGMPIAFQSGQACVDMFPDYQFPVFPGRMYWPEFQSAAKEVMSFFQSPDVQENLISKLRGTIRQLQEVHTAKISRTQVSNAGDGRKASLKAISLSSAARKRRLGSGVGGMVTDLIQLLTENPNSPIYKLIDALGSIWNKINSYSCHTQYCEWLRGDGVRDLLASGEKVLLDMFTTILTVLNICSIAFFLVGNLGFSCYDILLQFPKMRAIFNRERANGMYRTSSFLLGKMCADLPFHLIPGLVWAVIYYFMAGLDSEVDKVFKFMGVAILTSFAAYSMGYLISSIVLRLETSIVLSPLILIAMLVLAGFFIRDAEMPAWIAWARYLSIYRWSYFAVQLIQFPPHGSYGAIPNDLALMLAGVTDNSLGRVCGYLLAISFGCRLCTYFGLAFLHKSQGLQA